MSDWRPLTGPAPGCKSTRRSLGAETSKFNPATEISTASCSRTEESVSEDLASVALACRSD
jgi:hypothetical protein